MSRHAVTPMRRLGIRLALVVAIVAAALFQAWTPGFNAASEVRDAQRAALQLPPEALDTLERIRRGEALPYRQDGTTFQNREGLLPSKPRGYYREYTVPTPGARDRGARRFVTGGDPPEVFYYTEDHYRSFRRIEITP